MHACQLWVKQFKTINPGYDPGVEEGTTIVTFDTTGYPPALFIAQMYLQGSDAYGRSYSLTWPFWEPSPLFP